MVTAWRTLARPSPTAMSRRPDHPLRPLTDTERDALTAIGRSRSESAEHVTRARALLEVAAGASFSEAARRVGRKSGDAVGHLVARFNDEGLPALASRKSPGRPPTYSDDDRARILAEFKRTPDREADGTAAWSLVTLRDALRRAPDGLPTVSTHTILMVLHAAGYSWQRDRTWCPTGTAVRKRKTGLVTVVDPDAAPKKS
jgi:transposase